MIIGGFNAAGYQPTQIMYLSQTNRWQSFGNLPTTDTPTSAGGFVYKNASYAFFCESSGCYTYTYGSPKYPHGQESSTWSTPYPPYPISVTQAVTSFVINDTGYLWDLDQLNLLDLQTATELYWSSVPAPSVCEEIYPFTDGYHNLLFCQNVRSGQLEVGNFDGQTYTSLGDISISNLTDLLCYFPITEHQVYFLTFPGGLSGKQPSYPIYGQMMWLRMGNDGVSHGWFPHTNLTLNPDTVRCSINNGSLYSFQGYGNLSNIYRYDTYTYIPPSTSTSTSTSTPTSTSTSNSTSSCQVPFDDPDWVCHDSTTSPDYQGTTYYLPEGNFMEIPPGFRVSMTDLEMNGGTLTFILNLVNSTTMEQGYIQVDDTFNLNGTIQLEINLNDVDDLENYLDQESTVYLVGYGKFQGNSQSKVQVETYLNSPENLGCVSGRIQVENQRMGINLKTACQETVKGSSSSRQVGVIVGAVLGSFFALLIIVVLVVLIIRRKSLRNFQRRKNAYLNEVEISSIAVVTISKKIGSGSFGEVFLGIWEGNTVACKKVTEEGDEFFHEIANLKSVDHPNIVQCFGTASGGTELYLMMEYMSLGSLDSLILKFRPNISIYVDIACQCAAGMMHLVSKNITHRDLALRNVLAYRVGTGFKVKISDFGMARQNSDVKSEATKIPVRWCAPEVLLEYKFSFASDVWAFGILLWEIFSQGKSPYSNLSLQQVATSVLEGERMKAPENCPKSVSEVMMSCWHKNAEDRPNFTEISAKLESERSRQTEMRQKEGLSQDVEIEWESHPKDDESTSNGNASPSLYSMSPSAADGQLKPSYSVTPALYAISPSVSTVSSTDSKKVDAYQLSPPSMR